MASKRAVKITIDRVALQHNFQLVKKFANGSKIMPVIKANAYGHGLLQVADTLQQADGFAVAQLTEAVMLRENGVEKPITVFQGFTDAFELEQLIKYKLRPALTQTWQIDMLASVEKMHSTPVDVWLKINTGMGRLGVQPDEVKKSWLRLQQIDCIDQAGVMMHFANADDPSHLSNTQQIERFQQLTCNLQAQSSVSNSGAIINQLYLQQDWVRPGIMLYGSSPLINRTAQELGLQAVMSVEAKLIALNHLSKGQHVGYGDNWTCPENMPVGIVNIGYGDGYPRHAQTGTPVAVNEQITQLIGRVSMDSIAVDLRGIKTRCGDSVELWGKQIPVDDVALSSNTISYELLCNVGRA